MHKYKKFTARLTICVIFAAVLLLGACSSDSESDITAPAGYAVAESDVLDCYFFYPGTWQCGESGGMLSVMRSDGSDNSSFSVIRVESETEITPAEYWDGKTEDAIGYKEELETIFTDFRMISSEDIKVGDMDAVKKIYIGTLSGVEYKFMQVVAIKQSRNILKNPSVLYLMTYTSTPALYDVNIADIDRTVESFSLK